MFNEDATELIKQAFADYAHELELQAKHWEEQHPEEAEKRNKYWEAHQEEFERKLLAKIKERQCE